MYNTSGFANLQVRAFSAQTALVRVNQEVGFLGIFAAPAADLLGGQSLSPVEISTFSMRPAYFSGQGIQELLPLVLTH